MTIKEHLSIKAERTKLNIKFKCVIICLMFGSIFISYSYFLGYNGNFNYSLFWIGILISSISSFIAIINIHNQTQKLVILFCFGLVFYLTVLFWSPSYFRFQDEIYHVNSVELMLKSENLDINPMFEISKYYPGLQFLTIFFMKFSGLSLFVAAKLMVGIIHSMMLIFLYLLFKVVSSQKIAILGALIYTANPSYIFFDAIFSYETLGITLVIILIYTLYKRCMSNNKINLSIISLIILGALIITHPFSSYMLSVFLLIFVFLIYYTYHAKIVDIKKIRNILTFVIITFTLIFSWTIYQAIPIIRYFEQITSKITLNILSLVIDNIQRKPFWQSQLPLYEIFIDTYLYIPILFLLCIYGIYIINKDLTNNDIFKNAIYISLILYGLMLFLSLPLIFTKAAGLIYRTWAFSFIGLSFVMAISIDRLINNHKYLVNVMVILIIMGGVSIGSSYVLRNPNYVLASTPSSITLDVIASSNWFESKFEKNYGILGDETIKTVFAGYNNQFVSTNSVIFVNSTTDIEIMKYLKHNIYTKFVIVDKRITENLSEYKYYFNKEELGNNGHKYGNTETFPFEYIEKFNNEQFYYRIYNNKNINIYFI